MTVAWPPGGRRGPPRRSTTPALALCAVLAAALCAGAVADSAPAGAPLPVAAAAPGQAGAEPQPADAPSPDTALMTDAINRLPVIPPASATPSADAIAAATAAGLLPATTSPAATAAGSVTPAGVVLPQFLPNAGIQLLTFASGVLGRGGKSTDVFKKDGKFNWESKMSMLSDPIALGLLVFNLIFGNKPEAKPFPQPQDILDAVERVHEEVNKVQETLYDIQKTLEELKVDVLKAACQDKLETPLKYFATLQKRWAEFAEIQSMSISKLEEIAATTDMQHLPSAQLVSDKALAWADKMLKADDAFNPNVETILDHMHTWLMSPIASYTSAFAACGDAYKAEFQAKRSSNNPWDDRQYYGKMELLVSELGFWQIAGVQMMQEAHQIGAYKAVTAAARAANVTLEFGQETVLDFCGRVARTSAKNMIWATGRALCQAVPGFTKKYYSNLVQQFEAAGAPHSWGDKLGEGTRLILGTDVMGFTTAEVRDSTGGSPTATRFLMPASAAAFDPRCNGTNDPSAVKPGCAAVGTHASMKARATRTAPWSGPAAEARIYGGLNWTFNTDWEAVRATLNGSVPAPGDNPDWRSRDMPSRMDAGVPEGVTPVPFSGISDRVWWSPEKYNYWVANFLIPETDPNYMTHEFQKNWDKQYLAASSQSKRPYPLYGYIVKNRGFHYRETKAFVMPGAGAKGKDIPNRDGGGTHTPNASVTPNWRVGGLVLSMEDLRGAVKWSHYNPPDHYSSQWTWDGSFGDVATWEFGASGFAHTKDLGGLANLGNCSMRIGCAAKYPAKVKGYETGGNDFAFGTCLMADPSVGLCSDQIKGSCQGKGDNYINFMGRMDNFGVWACYNYYSTKYQCPAATGGPVGMTIWWDKPKYTNDDPIALLRKIMPQTLCAWQGEPYYSGDASAMGKGYFSTTMHDKLFNVSRTISGNGILWRMPSLSIRNLVCTATPPELQNPAARGWPSKMKRANTTRWGVPTRCGQDMTRYIVSRIGPNIESVKPEAGAAAKIELRGSVTSCSPISCPVRCSANFKSGDVTATEVAVSVRDGPFTQAEADGAHPFMLWKQVTQLKPENTDPSGLATVEFDLAKTLNGTAGWNKGRIVSCSFEGAHGVSLLRTALDAAPVVAKPWKALERYVFKA